MSGPPLCKIQERHLHRLLVFSFFFSFWKAGRLMWKEVRMYYTRCLWKHLVHCKALGKKLLMVGKGKWEYWLWEAERNGKLERDNEELWWYFYFPPSLPPPSDPGELWVFWGCIRPWRLFSSPRGVPFSAARGRYCYTELGSQLQN